MFIELPRTLASSADPYPDLEDGLDDRQTVTLARLTGSPQPGSRMRVAAGRPAAPEDAARFSVDPDAGFEGTFTQAHPA